MIERIEFAVIVATALTFLIAFYLDNFSGE